jgi:uncharacterized protein (DUF433 family)
MSKAVEIVKTPDVLHGKPRIEGTRIGAFTIGESVRAGGQSIEDMLTAHPDLTREQVEAALDYYDDHPEAMDILRQQQAATRQRVLARSRAPDAPDASGRP